MPPPLHTPPRRHSHLTWIIIHEAWRGNEMFPLNLKSFTRKVIERKIPANVTLTAALCNHDCLGPAPTHQILATALRVLRESGMSKADAFSPGSRLSSWTEARLLRKSLALFRALCARSLIVSCFLVGLCGWTILWFLRSAIVVTVLLWAILRHVLVEEEGRLDKCDNCALPIQPVLYCVLFGSTTENLQVLGLTELNC